MFDRIKNIFKPKSAPKKRVRKVATEITQKRDDAKTTEADIKLGKELFWGRYPHYPEMSTVYRKIFQKFEIDNTRQIKVYDSICGTDMCNIASGSGPNVHYMCDDKYAKLVDKNIKKLGLGDKLERLIGQGAEGDATQYFAHVFSFYPKLDHEGSIDWQALDDITAPGGFVFLPKLVTNPTDETKKPSQKLADNIAFYYYIELDHTAHWISMLENKIATLKKDTPPGLNGANKAVIDTFRREVTKWAQEIKKLKSKKTKIVTSVYKHDDE
jgi:hypothetical protein